MNDDYITTVDMALNGLSTTKFRSNLVSDTGFFIGTTSTPSDWNDLTVKGIDFNGPCISQTGPYSYTYETDLTINSNELKRALKNLEDGDSVGIPKYKLKHR